ncbi:MAG: ABC transporter permease [Thermoleophilia bacterium]|nr:ABC transporter permease [Thermoleophilia bacterium]
MRRVALRGLAGRKLRSLLTGLAIVLGVAMVSGSFVLTDTIGRSFDRIFDDSFENADVVVSAKEATSSSASRDAPAFPATVLDEVERLDAVAATLPSIEDEARLVGAQGELLAAVDSSLAFGVDGGRNDELNPLRLLEGEWPQGPGTVAIDAGSADGEGLGVGDSIGVVANGPVRDYRIAGIVQFGSSTSIGGLTIAVFDLATAQALFAKRDRLDAIQVAGVDGVASAELAAEIRPLLPETARVRTAAAQAEQQSKDTRSGLGFIQYVLLAFGGIALFVGSFVIANTLSITVTQRVRELATLRTIGASRRQVLWSVVLEGALIGLLASVVGLFVGLAIALALNELLAALGIELPSGGLVLAPRTVVVSVLIGTGIAVAASLRPALRATRVPPIAAVREGAVLPASRLARLGLPVALAVVGVAVALLAYGVFADGLATVARLLAIAGGTLLLFLGVALLAPRLVSPLAWLLGWPGARLGGVAARLARENAARNPGRTATTAAALMVGLALVTFVSILGQGLRTSFSESVSELFVADYSLNAGNDPLNRSAAGAAARAEGVEVVSAIRGDDAQALGERVHVNGVEPNVGEVLQLTWESGSDRVPAELGSAGAFVKDEYAEEHGLRIGSRLALRTPTGDVVPLRVAGVFAEPTGGSPFGEIAVSSARFDRSFTSRDSEFTFVNMRGGVTAANTAALERAVAAFPEATVETRDQFRDRQLSQLDAVLNALYALLALSVIVSLLGIVNTLVLSVFERTRELGMLRAIGMSRRQVRRMIRHESIVTALIGAALGIAVGVFLAALVTRTLSDQGIVFALPYVTLVVFVAVAIAAGVIAAILPARRASRLNVLQALQYE